MVKILVNTTRKHYVEVDVFLETIVILIMNDIMCELVRLQIQPATSLKIARVVKITACKNC